MMLPLLAAFDLRSLSDWFRSGKALDWSVVLPVLGALTALFLFVTWLTLRSLRLRERRLLNSPAKLLAELCAAHGLRHRDRQLVTALARHHNLAQPALLFLEPALWTAERLGATWNRRHGELDELRGRLFAA